MSSPRARVLCVEDNAGDALLVDAMLTESCSKRFHLLNVARLADALSSLAGNEIDAIILDLGLPDSNGIETLSKVSAAAPAVPIIVLSGTEDDALAALTLQLGAEDFLNKNYVTAETLGRSLLNAIERKRLQGQLLQLAHYDVLTGLANRSHFYDRLKGAMAWTRTHESMLALMFIDLNDFKIVNDTLGHHVGDGLLKGVGERLSACVREIDGVGRMGGDEFTIFLLDIRSAEEAAAVARRILDALAAPFMIDGHALTVRASIGISMYPADGENVETLVANADAAMYNAKPLKKDYGGYCFHVPTLGAAGGQRARDGDQLHAAFNRGEFVIHYQPRVDLANGGVTGVEALLRWQHDERGLLPASDFIATLERTALIVPVGAWVLGAACRQGVKWQRAGLPDLGVSVNVSPMQLRQGQLFEDVRRVLDQSGFDPRRLELEFPERILLDDSEESLDTLCKLDALGVRIALDGFGGGGVPIRRLEKLPVHAVKIDSTIIRDAVTETGASAVVMAMIRVAHAFELKGIATGVETPEQAEVLRSLRCDYAQGHVYSAALPAHALGKWLAHMHGEGAIEAKCIS